MVSRPNRLWAGIMSQWLNCGFYRILREIWFLPLCDNTDHEDIGELFYTAYMSNMDPQYIVSTAMEISQCGGFIVSSFRKAFMKKNSSDLL